MNLLEAPGAPLAVVLRNGEVESVHLGHLVIVTPDGRRLFERGQPDVEIYARSALKPVQALPLLLSGAAATYGLSDESLAVTLASHSGEAAHLTAVEALLSKAGIGSEGLQCGTHAPYHGPTALALTRAAADPTALHCNCSGKHAGMLAVCRHQQWDAATYRDPEHPLQGWIRALLSELSGVPEEGIGHGVDGCGAPVWRLPVAGLALTFARLANPQALPNPLRFAATRVAALMAAHPHLVAGTDRLDTDLLRAGGGRLLAKIGGEGVHAGGIRGGGLGWALKISDGNKRAIGPALARALGEINRPLPSHATLATHLAPIVYNNRGESVGEIKAAW